jgi:perosamine synthetase
MYAVVLDDEFPLDRDELMASLREAGIDTRTHLRPMNVQPFLRRHPAFRAIPWGVAEQLWRRGMYLPSSITLSDSDIEGIVEQVRSPVPS